MCIISHNEYSTEYSNLSTIPPHITICVFCPILASITFITYFVRMCAREYERWAKEKERYDYDEKMKKCVDYTT